MIAQSRTRQLKICGWCSNNDLIFTEYTSEPWKHRQTHLLKLYFDLYCTRFLIYNYKFIFSMRQWLDLVGELKLVATEQSAPNSFLNKNLVFQLKINHN